MPACTRPAADFTPEQLRFHSIPGFTVRADFAGGELSSDLGAAVLAAERNGAHGKIDNTRVYCKGFPHLWPVMMLSGAVNDRFGSK